MLEIGSIFDNKYKILSVIGQGGMSTVYLAMNERAGKTWAIKEIRKEGISDYRLVKQSLITEVSLLKNLSHPYIPTIVDVVEKDDSILIVMDYIEGNNLRKKLEEYGSFSQEYVIEWAKQLCDVLIYLHTRRPKIIYRDLKPGNIMLRPDGTICLIDFGTAREYKEKGTDDTVCLGTRGYAAPEQFGGLGQTDERTDIYCLGTTMYHLLTGHNPSEPPYQMYPIRKWNSDFSQGLEKIIKKCTEQNPNNRYSSCEEVLYDLQNYAELDQEYRKKAKKRVGLFSTAAALSIFFGVSSLVSGSYVEDKTENVYYELLDEAILKTDLNDKLVTYLKAVDTIPSKAQAYLNIINEVYMKDNIYSIEEDEQLRDIMLTSASDSGTREELLSASPEEYGVFAYNMGLTYFYSYDGDGNKSMSSYWFKKAVESGALDEHKNERAQRLGKIANYYTFLGKDSMTGDMSVSFKEYWEDLCYISDGNIVAIDNETTALMIYKEMAGQICLYGTSFYNSGIDYSEMTSQLEILREHLDNDFDKERINSNERLSSLMDKTQDLLIKADTAIKNASSQAKLKSDMD